LFVLKLLFTIALKKEGR
jgi:hypothetical protein